jgi:hypothetical protein
MIVSMTEESAATRILSRDEIRPNTIGPGMVLRGRYRVESEIGRGGMGIVYHATDHAHNSNIVHRDLKPKPTLFPHLPLR